MTAPGTWSARAGLAGRWGTVLLFAALVVRFIATNVASLNAEVARLAAQDRVLSIRGGDVALRDAPKAHEFRHGRFFSDPYYAGEHHWYPFLTPLVAATISRLGGGTIPVAFFRAEIGFVALYLVSLAALAFALARWPGLLFLPVVFWLGVTPGNGLYPTEAARGGFCLFLVGAGLLWERRALTPRTAAALGAGVGVLGLWNGASFFAAGGLATILVARVAIADVRRDGARALVRTVPFFAGGAALPLALLFAPQLLRHGHLAVPDAARTWIAPIYAGGTLTKALTLSLAPRGIHFALVVAALLPLARPLGLAPRLRAYPVLLAYFASLLIAHLGFLQEDRAHVALARAVAALLPAPAHTFLSSAEACRPAVELLGLLAILELGGSLARGRMRLPVMTSLVPPLALLANAGLLVTFPVTITRFSASETRAFARFAEDVAARVGDTPVFYRYPGRMLPVASIKILRLSVAEYANPYVQAARVRGEQTLDRALATGDVAQADAVLDAYGIGYVMEDPRAPSDPPVRRCGGEALLGQDGYILRKRQPCQR